MACLPFKSCCCGCSLKKGCIVIGLILGALCLLTFVSLVATAEHTLNENPELDLEAWAYIGLSALWAFFFVANLFLTIGVPQERPWMLIVWIVATTINVLVYTGMYSFAIYTMLTDNGGPYVIVTILSAVITIGPHIYCILAVYSFYLIISDFEPMLPELPAEPDPNARRWK